MRAQSILHPCITIPDLDEAVFFFRDLLGFELAERGFHNPAEAGPLLSLTDPEIPMATVTCADGTEVELMEFRRPKGERQVTTRCQDVGISVVTVIVEDVDAVVRELAAHGYPAAGAIVPFAGPDRDLLAVHVPGPGGIPLTLGQWVTPGTAGPVATE